MRLWNTAFVTTVLCLQLFGLAQAQEPPSLDARVPTTVLPAPLPDQAMPLQTRTDPGNLGENVAARRSEEEGLDRVIRDLKFKENAPSRYAADLFDYRQRSIALTEGGISDDYVLGIGDSLQVNLYGSANFGAPVQVDGRGTISIPKVGSIRVGGITLAKAKALVQNKVSHVLDRSTVDMEVIKLREIRVFVFGDVYKPGSWIVPSLSSLINVLSLSGGPTRFGSFRDIRVIRGGRVIHSFDLYPFRAEGLGNPNFMLQSGDILFVPISGPQISLEGGFRRVVQSWNASDGDNEPSLLGDEQNTKDLESERENLKRQIRSIEVELGLPPSEEGTADAEQVAKSAQASGPEAGQLQQRLATLNTRLQNLWQRNRGDRRIRGVLKGGVGPEDEGLPGWVKKAESMGKNPSMLFELRPQEGLAELVKLAGGIMPQAAGSDLIIRHREPTGLLQARTLPVATLNVELSDGDIVSAFPTRNRMGNLINLVGWVKMPGSYARKQGMRITDLIEGEKQLLPDSYLPKAELFRTAEDGKITYIGLDLGKALAGDPEHNLLLADRDRLEVFRVSDFRRVETVSVRGPVTRPGTYRLVGALRASDVLFWAGLPSQSANLLTAELARSTHGGPSKIINLEPGRLLPTEENAPVRLMDDELNPLLQADDCITLYEKPDFHIHRTVMITGQVAQPGSYTIDTEHSTIAQLIKRAGGLLPSAMPSAGIFLRRISSGINNATLTVSPGLENVSKVMERLSETVRQSTTGQILKSPVMHDLASGSLSRMVLDFDAIVKGVRDADLELKNGDQVIIPAMTESAFIIGETASPFATYRITKGTTVSSLLALAGGYTRNADKANIRLLRANGQIIDSGVKSKEVMPGDTIIVPQFIRRDSSWQESMLALMPLAILMNAIKL